MRVDSRDVGEVLAKTSLDHAYIEWTGKPYKHHRCGCGWEGLVSRVGSHDGWHAHRSAAAVADLLEAGWVVVRAEDVEFALIAMRVAKHEIEDLNVEAHFRAVTSGGYQ